MTLLAMSLFVYNMAFSRNHTNVGVGKTGKINKNAIQYKVFEEITANHYKLLAQAIFFSDHIAEIEKNPRKIEFKKKALLRKLDKEIGRLKVLNIKDEAGLADSMIAYYVEVKNIVLLEYNSAINLRQNLKMSHDHLEALLLTLEQADNSLVKTEESLYNIEKQYVVANKIKMPKIEEESRNEVIVNEEVIKYHNRMFLCFYKVYNREYDILNMKAGTPDSVINLQKKILADEILSAEDSLVKLGGYKGNKEMAESILQYFKYLRNQNFDNYFFYKEYVDGVEKKNNVATVVDQQKHEAMMKVAQSKLKESYIDHASIRGEKLEHLETTSIKFLYYHLPSFRK